MHKHTHKMKPVGRLFGCENICSAHALFGSGSRSHVALEQVALEASFRGFCFLPRVLLSSVRLTPGVVCSESRVDARNMWRFHERFLCPPPPCHLALLRMHAQATCEVHAVLRETFCCKDGHGVGPNKNDVPELLK